MKTLDDVRQAVDDGHAVTWKTGAYRVIKDRLGRYLITYRWNDSIVELSDEYQASDFSQAQINVWRNPTAFELRQGYGAIHYLTVPLELAEKAPGVKKRWFINPHDGLRYNTFR